MDGSFHRFCRLSQVCGVPRVRDMSDVAADEDSKGARSLVMVQQVANRWLIGG